MKFEELDLNDHILDALYDMHFDDCTPIQEKCIPPILEGRDLLGVAQTGTGKTAAYLLPILSKLDDGGYPKDAVNCIVMSPTRELAQQIDQAMQGFAYFLDGVSSVAVYGGNDGNRYDQEMKSMRLGADVIIATPGRLISHISMGNIDLSKVSFFVLDEADRMLDMGFSDDIMKIASKLPKDCQMIMFSATMPADIEKLAQTLLKNPVEVKLAVSKPAEKIQQSAYICYETQKLRIIKDIFKAGDLKRVIIFSGSKMKVKQINQALQHLKINSGEMHSDLEQAERDEMMFKFKSGQIDVLVATDILSRGIDIDDISMVINYDVPHDAEDYVHRIGRTARADKDGIAITFVNEDDMFAFHQIEKFLGKEIKKNPLPEDCGEGPEYTTSRRPGKTSAKSRRRKDRDNTSHRDNKQRNRSRRDEAKGQSEQRANGGQRGNDEQQNNGGQQGNDGQEQNRQRRRGRGAKPQDNGQKTGKQQGGNKQEKQQNGNRTDNRQQGGNRTDNRQQNGNRTDNRQQGGNRTDNRQQSGNRTDNRQQGGQRQEGIPQEKARRQRSRHKFADKQRGQQSQGNLSSQKAAGQQQDGGIANIIKHPLRWLRSLGKK